MGTDLSISASVRSRLAIDRVPEQAWLEWSAEGDSRSHRVAMPVVPGKTRSQVGWETIEHVIMRSFNRGLAQSITYRVVKRIGDEPAI